MDLLWFMKFHVSGVRSDYILAILQAVSQQTVSYQNIYFDAWNDATHFSNATSIR